MKCSEIDAQNQILFGASVHSVNPKPFEDHNEINLNVSVDNGHRWYEWTSILRKASSIAETEFAKASLSALTLPIKFSVTTLTQYQAFNSFWERRHEKRLSLSNFLMSGPFNTAALIFFENN